MFMYIFLMIVTIVYVLVSAVMDIRERKIYGCPAIFLSLAWVSYMLGSGRFDSRFLFVFAIFNISLWFIFNRIKMWGAGDSDMFLILSDVLLVVTGQISGIKIVMLECAAIIIVMLVAMLVCYIESKIKKEKITKNSNVAVVPGFAVLIIGLLFTGLCVGV